jgi:hypothetical protein
MQELLFGPSSSSSTASAPRPVQKPQPVRPSSTSAFSAYVPGRGLGTASPEPTRGPYTSYSSYKARDLQSPPNRQSPPKLTSYTRPTALSLSSTTTDYSKPEAALARTGSLRASAARGNWKELFPSLSRQPGQASSVAPPAPAPAPGGQSALARFCHECGNPFPMPHVRFCCGCGVKRLYT